MYHLEISKDKSYKCNPQTGEFYYIKQNKQYHILRECKPDERARRLVDLAGIRGTLSGNKKVLCTAFMMQLARWFPTYRIALNAVKELFVFAEHRNIALDIIVDVFEKKMKVSANDNRG
jgi:hypothetical protein